MGAIINRKTGERKNLRRTGQGERSQQEPEWSRGALWGNTRGKRGYGEGKHNFHIFIGEERHTQEQKIYIKRNIS